MKKKYSYIFILLLALLMVSCSSEEDNLAVNQRTAIETYLDRYSSDWDTPAGVYRYIITDRRDATKQVEKGDSVFFRFAAYQFTTSRQEPTFYTNFPELIEDLKTSGINVVFFPVEEEEVVIGSGKLIKALDIGLAGCYKGDSVSLFLTSNLAYGANYVGANLPMDSAVEYVINIEEVKKQ